MAPRNRESSDSPHRGLRRASLREHPALVMTMPMVAIALVPKLGDSPTPALLIDLLALGMAWVTDRRLGAGGIGVGIILVITALVPETRSTLVEYTSIIPVAIALLQGRTRLAGLFATSFLAALVLNARSGPDVAGPLLFWGTVYAMTLAVAHLIKRSNRNRQHATRRQLADQRTAIARELHDTVAHELSLMSMQVQELGIRGNVEPADLEFVLHACDNAIVQLRGMLSLLRSDETPRDLAGEPVRTLDEECRAAVDRLAEHGFAAEYQQCGGTGAVPSAVQWSLAGTCREAVSNSVKHGDARSPVTLSLEVDTDAGETRLAFFNQISAHHHPSNHTALGLIGIRERVEAIGGRLYTSRSGQQWMTMACLPNRVATATPAEDPAP